MADIKQTITIDTKSAIDSLANLENKLKQFSASLSAFGSNLSAVSRSLGSAGFKEASGQINAIAQAFRKLNNTGKATGPTLQTFAQATNEVGARGAAAAKIMDDFIASAQGIGQAVAQSSNQAAGASNRFASQFTSSFNAARSASINFGNIFKNVASSIISSFQNIGRVLATQLIVSAFGNLRRAIAASVSDFIEFGIKVREIETILPDASINADRLAGSIRRLSDTFGLPLSQVTEGLYQAVSNQIGDAATSLRFLESAARFATVAVTDIDTSVNLLSGALNAFNKDISEVDVIAAKFFKTIELGRTRAEELEISFGRVGPIVEQLGGSLDELLAAFATVTIAGIKTSEATTQIRGALNAIIKPTAEAAEVFRKAGFESGDLAFQALGLQGTLELLRESTGGSQQEFAKLIPRVRGLNAALLLTSRQGAELFEQNLRKIQAAGEDLIKSKFEIIFESNAKVVEREFQRLKNVFTVDIGGALVSVLASSIRLTNGFTALINVLKAIITTLAIATTAFGIYTLAVNASTIGLKALDIAAKLAGTSLGALSRVTGPIGLVLTAILAVTTAIQKQARDIENLRNKIAEFHNSQIEQIDKRTSKALQSEDLVTRHLVQQLSKRFAAENKVHTERIDNLNEQIRVAQRAEERLLSAVVRAREQTFRKAIQSNDRLNDLSKEAAENSLALAGKLSDLQVKSSIKEQDGVSKVATLQQRAFTLAQQGAQQLKRATDKEQADAARAILDRADAFQSEAASVAESLGNRLAVNESDRIGIHLLQTRIQAEKALSQTSAQKVADNKRTLELQKAQLTRAKQIVARLKEIDLLDKKSKDVPGAAVERKRLLTEFGKLAGISDVISLRDLIDTAGLSTEIEDQLTETELKKLIVGDGAVDNLKKQIEAEMVRIGGIITPIALEVGKLTGQPAPETVEELNRALIELPVVLKELTTQLAEQEKASKDLGKAYADLALDLSELILKSKGLIGPLTKGTSAFSGSGSVATTFDQALANVRESQIELTKNLIAGKAPTEAQLATLDSLAKGLDSFAGAAQGPINKVKEINAGIKAAVEQSKTLKLTTELQNLGTVTGTVKGDIDNITQGIARMAELPAELQTQLGALSGASSTLKTTNENVAKGIDLLTAAYLAKLKETNSKYDALAQKSKTPITFTINEVTVKTTIEKTVKESRGGKIRGFQAGGFANRGTDIIPAMLSPGEFVINAKSTRKFFSQLVAINAGRTPIFKQEGGPVSGATTFGDINVTVKSDSRNPDSTARNIARGLRRELRRNNFQF